MKRFSSSDSLGALVSICPPKEKKNPKKSDAYSREFQAMLDGFEEEDSAEENGKTTEKKRRLSFDQVKALEKCFEAVNKLEPDRKLKIAQELGLQPRQVAVWFQNRRARWKTKQLEKDYVILKASYDSLKLNFDTLEREKEALIAELKELKLKLQDENTESNHSVKKEALFSESDNIVSVQSPFPVSNESESANPSHDFRTNSDGLEFKGFVDFKDGTSDSGSSGILKEDSNLNAQQQKSPASSSLRFDYSSSLSSSSSMNGFHLSNSIAIPAKACQHQFVRIEEQNLFSTDESCNFFSVDQAPTLHWYFHDQ